MGVAPRVARGGKKSLKVKRFFIAETKYGGSTSSIGIRLAYYENGIKQDDRTFVVFQNATTDVWQSFHGISFCYSGGYWKLSFGSFVKLSGSSYANLSSDQWTYYTYTKNVYTDDSELNTYIQDFQSELNNEYTRIRAL